MPYITITATQPVPADQKKQLIQNTHDAVIETLSVPVQSIRIILHELPEGSYFCAGQFDVPAIIYDIDMMAGRTEDAKAKLIHRLSQVAHEATSVSFDEVRTRITEFPKENMGMAGGITAKQAGR